MDKESLRRVHRITAWIASTAVVFAIFFQINKGGPLGDINPFREDPYDAVGSFAIQVALLIGLLTYARALRLEFDPGQSSKTRLIVRGNTIVVLAILVTLAADAWAVIHHPLPPSKWSAVLLAELAGMSLLAATSLLALAVVFQRLPTQAPPGDLTLADAIDDLWTLVRVPASLAGGVLPRGVVEWSRRANSDWLFGRLPWVDPRAHPWRFASILSLLVGGGLVLAQWQEGLPPNLQAGLLVVGIFISAEFTATLAGLAIFGGYLGLRPPLGKRS